MQIDLHVLELLASKLCHDLVSPISAINNGVELINDIGGTVVDEAMSLIGNSADQASRRLRLFRLAYGRAGSEENLAVKDVRPVVEQYLTGGKVTLNWPENAPCEEFALHRGSLKTIVNLLILAEELLAYGGTITVHTFEKNNKKGCRIEVAGRNAQMSSNLLGAMEDTLGMDELTPRNIQAYITGKFATHFGLTIQHSQTTGDVLDMTLTIMAS